MVSDTGEQLETAKNTIREYERVMLEKEETITTVYMHKIHTVLQEILLCTESAIKHRLEILIVCDRHRYNQLLLGALKQKETNLEREVQIARDLTIFVYHIK